MNMKRILDLWKDQQSTLNGWISLNNAFGAEVMAYAGFDTLTIDTQHGVSDYSSLIPMLQAIKPIPTFVRVPWLEESSIMKSLDAGVNGIICPMINSKKDAQRLVKSCYYPPYGERSFGPIRAKFLYKQNYFEVAKEETFVFAMIETKEAFENLEEILSVEGIDGVYIGPADLSCSLGVTPKFDQEDEVVFQAIKLILQKTKKYQKFCGIHNGSAAYAKKMEKLGFNFLTLGSDAIFMLEGAKKIIQDFHCN